MRLVFSALAAAALLGLFASPADAVTTAAARTPTAHAVIRKVGPTEWSLIRRTGTWRPGCPGRRTTFRRVEVDYHGFDGKVHRGALVVNRDVAVSVARIMTRLFDDGFPIHRMQPIETYGGDDDASMRADNTSAMNCRKPAQANAPARDSPHANGRAIDINPWENPWVDPRCGCFRPDRKYGHLRHGRGVVTATVVDVFSARGWIWRGRGSSPDLQHFDTGYPSRPPRH